MLSFSKHSWDNWNDAPIGILEKLRKLLNKVSFEENFCIESFQITHDYGKPVENTHFFIKVDFVNNCS